MRNRDGGIWWEQKGNSPLIKIRKKLRKKTLLCLFSNKICNVLQSPEICFFSSLPQEPILITFFFLFKCSLLRCLTSCLDFLSDPNCQLEDKVEDGEVLDCKKRPDEGEELEEEVVHSCDSCLQVFESLSDITEHKINQCQLTGKQYLPLCGFFHCSISNSHPLLLIFSLLSQLYYFCN